MEQSRKIATLLAEGLTQREVAERVGVTRDQVRTIADRGLQPFDKETVRLFCEDLCRAKPQQIGNIADLLSKKLKKKVSVSEIRSAGAWSDELEIIRSPHGIDFVMTVEHANLYRRTHATKC
jgi:transcriptional regulator with XRE-family HTH domain